MKNTNKKLLLKMFILIVVLILGTCIFVFSLCDYSYKTISNNSYPSLVLLVDALNDYKNKMLGSGKITLDEYFDFPYEYIDQIDTNLYTIVICKNSVDYEDINIIDLRFIVAYKDSNKNWKLIEKTAHGKNFGTLKVAPTESRKETLSTTINQQNIILSLTPFKNTKSPVFKKSIKYGTFSFDIYYSVI